MGRGWWSRFLFLIFLTVLAAGYVFPTLTNLDTEKTKFPFKDKVNLGLDLQGGLYMVLGVDFNKVFKDVVSRQVTGLEVALKEANQEVKSGKLKTEGLPPDDPHVLLEFDASKRDAILALVKKQFWLLRLAADNPGQLEFGLTSEYRGEVREKTMNQSIQVIRNRIDEFGVTEPVITSQGNDRLVVELPGVKDIERAKGLIGRTAKLEFKIVADKLMDQGKVAQMVADIEKEKNITYKEGSKFSDYVTLINEGLKGKLPEGTEIAFERTEANLQTGEPSRRLPYLLFSKADVTGEDLSDAQVGFNEDRTPEVDFQMNPKGANSFGKLTGDHTGDRMAIVLDGIVHSAPVIQSKISDRGRITLGRSGGDLLREAKDLAIVLRAGALPAQLDFLEQRVIGPTLGQDSIHKGTMATVAGALAVFIFMIFYYRVSGVIAVISLILNFLFTLACLVGMEATLTLPGIAGLALTVGIAVDSNVVIYERIREEIRAGKRPHGAVEAGFQKAFRTILDANVTNAAAAVVLLVYGTGPIKGFAVTMLIGIVMTLFTAVFFCKLVFDWYLKVLDDRGSEALSI